MKDIHPAAAAGFSSAADEYERGRPGYPAEAIAWIAGQLQIGPGRDVLDLAAGFARVGLSGIVSSSATSEVFSRWITFLTIWVGCSFPEPSAM